MFFLQKPMKQVEVYRVQYRNTIQRFLLFSNNKPTLHKNKKIAQQRLHILFSCFSSIKYNESENSVQVRDAGVLDAKIICKYRYPLWQ